MNILREQARRYREYYDAARVAEYIHEHCPEESGEILRQAELLLKHTFVYTDRWDMEPCSIPYTISLDDWITSPNGDPEWVFMLNRHDFLHKLWQAYTLTENRQYIEKLRYYILDWISKNSITEQGSDATRTIDTGIRCMNWSILLMHLLAEDCLSDGDACTVLSSLADQCRNMRLRYIGKYALSNWGVLQTTAICTAHLWFPEFIPEDVADWAWDELRKQLGLQILSDGSHWEQSPMYHTEVLNTCTKLLAQLTSAAELGISLNQRAAFAFSSAAEWDSESEAEAGPGEGYASDGPGWLVEAVRVLSRHVLYTSDPSFRQLPLGDSDVTDVSDVLARATVLLSGSGIYRYGAGEWIDLDSAFLLGWPGISLFHSVSSVAPRRTHWDCLDSGNICFRSQWSEKASFTALKCGTLGSSHGHVDQTHFMLYNKGKPFLIDSGRYTYVEDDPLRTLLKKACAHNVCVIDGQSGGTPKGSWSYHSYDETLKNFCSHIGCAHYVEMGFHGRLADATPYVVIRKLIALDDAIWLSSQDVICEGSHHVKEYFHLHENCSVDCSCDRMKVTHGDAGIRISADEATELRFGIVSDKYNEKHYAPILVKVNRMKDRMTTYTTIVDADYQVSSVPVYQLRRTEPVPQEVAAAWDVVKPDGKKYTLILWNRETCQGDKLYACHGISVYGKAVVLDWEGDVCRTIRLRV